VDRRDSSEVAVLVPVNPAAYVECASRVDCLGAVAGEAGVSVVEIAEIGVLMI
jgi:hypothetical protein